MEQEKQIMQRDSKSRMQQGPALRHIANLWTLQQHPSREKEWSLDDKLSAMRDADFHGVCWGPIPGLCEAAKQKGLIFVGGMVSGQKAGFGKLLRDLKDSGATHVNVQLGSDDTGAREALEMAIVLMREGESLGLLPAIEFHRGTCTETPEKAYALADAYADATGQMLRISWDFSHFAVVKHLVPSQYEERLLVRPDLIQHAQQFHFRPFNGHHAQIPVTCAGGELTQETREWLRFAEAILRCWLAGNNNKDRDLFICPELGPAEGGYALSTFPNSWEDAKVLRAEIDRLWRKVTN